MSTLPKFYDANERPPQMGWHYFYDLQDGQSYFRRASAEDVFAELKRFRVNNGKSVSDTDLWRELWVYWCSREPGRCATEGESTDPTAAPFLPREITPEFFGPIIWKMMNLMAARFDAVGKSTFVTFLLNVLKVMTCPDCKAEWERILADSPPLEVNDAKSACRWVVDAHNRVNARTGKRQYTYERGVLEYGFPLP